jgi:hypothetical protein
MERYKRKVFHLSLDLDPWPHMIHDKFFTGEELEILKDFQKQRLNKNWMHFVGKNDGRKINELLQNKAWDMLYPTYLDLSRVTKGKSTCYSTKAEDVFFRIATMCLPPGHKHTGGTNGVHLDDEWKQLTTIVYFSEESKGTDLYTSETSEPVKNIGWKFNKGYSFIPSKYSWHNFEHPESIKSKRLTLMFIMCNKRYYV